MRRGPGGNRASTLLIALLTTAGLAVIVGMSLLNITSRAQTAARSCAFNEAGQAADTAAALAVAEIRRVMPDLATTPDNAWSGWKIEVNASLVDVPVIKSLDASLKISLTPPALVHAGEGSGSQISSVTIDAPAGLADSGGRQWLRVKAVGTSFVPGWRGPSKNKLDNQLRGIAFVHDWHGGAFNLTQPTPSTSGATQPTAAPPQKVKVFDENVARPQVSRWLEVIVQPVSPYNAAVSSPGAIKISNSRALVDSFDSSDPTKSRSGIYDSTVRQRNGGISTNGTDLTLQGEVYGNVSTTGGTKPAGVTIYGNFTTDGYRTYPPVPDQSSGWITLSDLVAGLKGKAKKLLKGSDITLTAALDEAGRYQLPGLSGNLTIDGPVGSTMEIMIDGSFSGSLRVTNGVRAIVYFKGNVNLSASNLTNDTLRAGNLQLIGLEPLPGENRTVTIDLNAPLYASIYAPSYALTFTGDGDFMGAVVAKSFTATGKVKMHYDEALARLPKPIADYKVASWVEEVR